MATSMKFGPIKNRQANPQINNPISETAQTTFFLLELNNPINAVDQSNETMRNVSGVGRIKKRSEEAAATANKVQINKDWVLMCCLSLLNSFTRL
jgi:hypothetical protein